ncbi:tRNA-dihydrouridine synthase [Escherichia coli]
MAEDCGIQALTIHGRTRACLFNGEAEYDSIRAVKQKVSIPVIANGDITDPLKARAVLDYTGADALMIGRAAQGKTLDFSGNPALSGHWEVLSRCLWQRLSACFARTFGNCMTFMVRQKVRIARKHVSLYLQEHAPNDQFRRTFNAIEDAERTAGGVGGILRKFCVNRNKELTELCSNNA